ncbi:MAG: DUF4129 domain-containing protein [Cyclobacteriaceae bacterium]
MKQIVFALLMGLIFVPGRAHIEPPKPTDSVAVESRSFDSNQLKQLKEDPTFDYSQPPTVAETLWDRFKELLTTFFYNLYQGAAKTHFGRLFLYGLGLAALAFIIMMIMRVDALRVFYAGADKGSIGSHGIHENIHELDFDRLIREAIEKGEYRMATRLTFLHALKMLADGHWIEWKPGKTNHDYVDEIEASELKAELNELSFYFDYAWYGNFKINSEIFQRTQNTFRALKSKLSSHA